MNKTVKILGAFSVITFLFIALTASKFWVQAPDFNLDNLKDFEGVSTKEIGTANEEMGWLKTQVTFSGQGQLANTKEFYGQVITIDGNHKLDRICVGVTSNLISRIEMWNDNELVAQKELGFMNKMTFGGEQELSVVFFDQNQSKHDGKAGITMRFFEGTGFLGDIGTISMDLTEFGNLTGNKSIATFQASIEENRSLNQSYFTDLRIWKNYAPID